MRCAYCAIPAKNRRSRTCECIPIPASKTSLILLASCSVRGCFLETILQRTERELAGPGRPGTADRLVAKVERREVPRPTSLGARGALPREVGTLIPPPRVPAGALAPPAAPPPRLGSRGTCKPRTLCAARTRKCGCLKFESPISCPGRDAAFFMPLRRTGTPVISSRKQAGPRLCSAPLREELRAALRPGSAKQYSVQRTAHEGRISPRTRSESSWLPCCNECCVDATVSEHLPDNPAGSCARRYLATPLHEIIPS